MKLNFLILVFSIISLIASAQNISRPSNIGHGEMDNFVNRSFDIYDKTKKNEADLKATDLLLTQAEKNAVKFTLNESDKMQKSISLIEDNSKQVEVSAASMIIEAPGMVTKANKLPITKSLKAIKNLNKAQKALNYSKNNVVNQIKLINQISVRYKKLMGK